MLKNASDISDHTLISTSDSNESFDTLIVSSDEIEAAAGMPRLIHTMPTSAASQRLIFEKCQPYVEEAEDHSPDLFSQQEETGNQSPDMFSQQEETGNQSPKRRGFCLNLYSNRFQFNHILVKVFF